MHTNNFSYDSYIIYYYYLSLLGRSILIYDNQIFELGNQGYQEYYILGLWA